MIDIKTRLNEITCMDNYTEMSSAITDLIFDLKALTPKGDDEGLLTVPELVELRFKYNNLKPKYPRGEAKNMRWDRYIAKEQRDLTLSLLPKGDAEILLVLSPTRFIRKITDTYNTEEEWFEKGKRVQLEQDQAQRDLTRQERELENKQGEGEMDDITNLINGSGAIITGHVYHISGSQISELITKWKQAGRGEALKERLDRPDRGKIIDLLHWTEYRFVGQDNATFEGCLTQESEEQIADKILALFDEKGGSNEQR